MTVSSDGNRPVIGNLVEIGVPEPEPYISILR